MRELMTHAVNEINEALRVEADDETKSIGGGCNRYKVSVRAYGEWHPLVTVNFHQRTTGPAENSLQVNGLTNEVLLAVLIDRLQGFQKGPFSCRENALALTKLEEGLHWLNARTREREARGVEGDHKA